MTSIPSLPPPAPEVGTMLGLPVALAVGGVLLRVLDEVYAAMVANGEHISLGPLRLAWLAALLIGVGAILALARFFRHVAR